jgi:FkbM family methyltransferase
LYKTILTTLRKHPKTVSFALSTYKLLRPKGVKIVNTHGLKLCVDWRADPSLLFFGQYSETFETKLFLSKLKPDSTVVDAGANFGWYSLLAAKQGATVYAFEPEETSRSQLEQSISLNKFTNIQVYPYAASNQEGTTQFYLSNGWSGSSLTTDNPDANKTVTVKTVTLDKQLSDGHVDVLKMDVEGAEALVLEGAEKLLKKDMPDIFMEFYPKMLADMKSDPWFMLNKLEEKGYTTSIIDEVKPSIVTASIETIKRQWQRNNELWRCNLYLTNKN